MLPQLSPQFMEDKHRLDVWRETAGRRPIPDGLWKAAVSHVKEYGLNRVSREFRLGYTKLKEKTLSLGGSLPEAKPAQSSSPHFIELALPREIPTQVGTSPRLRLVFERADGNRLSVEGSQPDLAFMDGLIHSFYSR
jgi:hypothetical protein